MSIQGQPDPSSPPPRPPAPPWPDASRAAPRPTPLRGHRTANVWWLAAISLVLLFVPLVLINNAIRADTTRLTADLNAVHDQMNLAPTPVAEVRQLMAQITQVQSQTAQLDALRPTLKAPHHNWPIIAAVAANYDPNQIDLSSIAYGSRRLTISGRALNDTVVVNYAHTLEQSGVFNQVIVQSIKRWATPVATATPTITPGVILSSIPTSTPSWMPTATPDLRDEYEPDNTVAQAKPIAIGIPQQRNFYPGLDVDLATVLVKSGRFYRIYTADLAPGVDTFLSASVGDVAHINDDAKPGTLASEVVFQNTGPDVTAVIRVTNRGQFGGDKRYQLIAEETVPTPGPAPTATNTPTLPPDLRDAYEPDETTTPLIVAAQPQLRNFYPDGDVDQASFLARTGRFYRVFTTDLAPGVDTFLTISAGGLTYTNDDARPGTLASEITFQVAGADAVAAVRITNRGQYGGDKRYQLVMEEFLPTPTVPASTATPLPTPTVGVAPAPTQDLRDRYEPDDPVPAPIAPGQTQAHNFYPFGDVDQVVFNAKAQRIYLIYSSDLAPGVDTVITATQGGLSWLNDDDAPPGSGNFASAVCFTPTIDGPAVVTITNQQPLYDPANVYSLTVSEVPSPPSPCAPPAPSAPMSIRGPGLSLSGGYTRLQPIQLIPTPDRMLIAQRRLSIELRQPPAEFMAVEFVIIVELKVIAP